MVNGYDSGMARYEGMIYTEGIGMGYLFWIIVTVLQLITKYGIYARAHPPRIK